MTRDYGFSAQGTHLENDAQPVYAARSPFYDSSEPSLGVMNFSTGRQHFQLLRYDPASELSDFVRHYWTVEWDLTGTDSHVQEVVPNPCVNLVIERGRTGCFTPSTARFSKSLSGKGKVFGVKFRPGGFYPFLREPLSPLAGLPIPVERIITAAGSELEQAVHTQCSGDLVHMLDTLLLAANPRIDAETRLLHEMTARIAEDRELTKVVQLCECFGLEKRTLQRLFNCRVGLSPKWVIRLHRLQEAAHLLDQSREAGRRPSLLQLSHELGYYDQTHFIKDFKTVVGVTPEAYVLGSQA
ncbi:helix-turn-helix domain-containing protein [Saccharibacillus kuerlensis]|uniref:AraC family transcriptional regulator n=1 Tax=Saccharibacillus kuerlensis TaxID=459527 RepID=A0ABQ2L8F3_9BACL|nr:helix-turn-helix domain-containing protein [Saccharibacillus kuerlensis]GGO04618.1 AraC family transcriptional regulator [Saccharibacillus kuerlensis]